MRDATVRSGCELSTPKIDMIEINTVVEALEVKTSRDGQKRFRCAEGWVSALTSKGTPLFQVRIFHRFFPFFPRFFVIFSPFFGQTSSRTSC